MAPDSKGTRELEGRNDRREIWSNPWMEYYVGMGKGERQRLARQVQSSGAGPCSGCEPGPEANRTRGAGTAGRRDGRTEGTCCQGFSACPVIWLVAKRLSGSRGVGLFGGHQCFCQIRRGHASPAYTRRGPYSRISGWLSEGSMAASSKQQAAWCSVLTQRHRSNQLRAVSS